MSFFFSSFFPLLPEGRKSSKTGNFFIEEAGVLGNLFEEDGVAVIGVREESLGVAETELEGLGAKKKEFFSSRFS